MRWLFAKKRDVPVTERFQSVDELYRHFKYVIPVNNSMVDWYNPITPYHDIVIWAEENNCRVIHDRVLYNSMFKKYESNGIGGEDILFFATNDSDTATLTALRWS